VDLTPGYTTLDSARPDTLSETGLLTAVKNDRESEETQEMSPSEQHVSEEQSLLSCEKLSQLRIIKAED
jgi:hypothetical protein